MTYVIRRIDGYYVQPAGSKKSYSPFLQHARRFATLEEAEADVCPENERAVKFRESNYQFRKAS